MAESGTKAISLFLNQKNVLDKFTDLLGTKAQGFITSVITAVNSTNLLINASQESIYSAALMAATLDLPLNQNLGFAYIIPFNNKKLGKQEAQFQIGYKGFIQLAMRSGQFKNIASTPIFEGQLINENPLMGFEFDFKIKSDKVIGYASFFSLMNGFEKTFYMSVDEIKKHGSSYSQSYKKGYGLWVDNFDAMAQKTVLKLLLSKYAPLSIEMQKATISDQSVIRNFETMEVDYVDNQADTPILIDEAKESERIFKYINDSKNLEDLILVEEHLDLSNEYQVDLFQERKKELSKIK